MTFQQYLQTSLSALRRNKSRSFLTILGIVIGILSIILVMSLGQGAQNLIISQFSGFGTKSVTVVPGRQFEGPSAQGLDSLKERDLDSLRNKNYVPHANLVVPMVFGNEVASFESETIKASVYGSSADLPKVFEMIPDEGSVFTEEDVKGSASVVVIGSKISEKLFPNGDGLGKRIKVKDRSYKIIGILPSKGSGSLINFDDGIVMPYTTAQNYVSGTKHFDRLLVDVDEEENMDVTVEDVTNIIRDNHNITDPDKDDFQIVNQADLLETFGLITSALTYFLAAVAAISLLVGGIGIMNIMLVSVTERTREIGLRKAVGATTNNVLIQFLVESVVLTLIGGIVGIILGALISFIVYLIINAVLPDLGWQFIFPVGGALLGIGVSTAIGLIFGVYPAKKAAKKSPIEALRYE
jgi:putative ABC transport system permease protein